MIRINRPPAPVFLSTAGNKWEKETEEAIRHYSVIPVVGDFEHRAYNDPLMKAELKKVFVKCAYCESQYDQSSDGDIEHFRPKGRVSEKQPQTPGYYWLANNWDNLLLSCQHCNQRRSHQLFGDEFLSSRGKVDQFPLMENYTHAARYDEGLLGEEPGRLLINPCIAADDPEAQFSYEETTSVIVGKSEKGRRSIEVYALLRPHLVRARNERKQFIFWQMDVVKKELGRFNQQGTAESKADLETALDHLLKYASADQPYAGMARFFIRRFLTENNIAL
jgi:uncharacterized protein (TIGR02646 family)